MIKFIHLSDLHISKRMSKDNNVYCKRIVKFLCERYKTKKPYVLITGDITDDGRKSQYKNVVKVLSPLKNAGFKMLACPGNHDYGTWGVIYKKKSQEYFKRYILCQLLGYPDNISLREDENCFYPHVTQTKDKKAVFIGVDSVLGNLNDELVHLASGEVGRRQRAKLIDILLDDTYKDKQKVVYFHHHLFDLSRVTEMDDAKKVFAILNSRSDVVCFGHDHHSKAWSARDNIDWILASGKSTEKNKHHKFQFREVSMDGDCNEVSMVSFR